MEIFEWDENIPVTANNLNEMQNKLNGNIELAIEENNPVVLYSNENGGQETIVLNDSKANYEYIEILGSTNGNAPVDFKIKTTMTNFDIFAIDYNYDVGAGIMFGKIGHYNFNDTSLVPTKMQWVSMQDNTGGSVTSNFTIFRIYKVLGYK